jgi:hypothetical protein
LSFSRSPRGVNVYSCGEAKDFYWKPWLPLAIPYGFLVAVHLFSLLSPAQPDPLMVVKYTLRPVLFAYLASVALLNFMFAFAFTALGVLVVVVCSLPDGLLSLFWAVEDYIELIHCCGFASIPSEKS